MKYLKENDVLFCAYREKKSIKIPVILISTKCEDQNVTITKNCTVEKGIRQNPLCFSLTYLHGWCRYDESDKMLYNTYFDERRTVKYWKKVAFDIINRMILNAYIIYKERVGNRGMTRLDFISDIIFYIECEMDE